MKRHLQNAILALNSRGYNQDFRLLGDELLWVEEKTMIAGQDFMVEQYYRINAIEDDSTYFALGIVTISKVVRGTLLIQYNYKTRSPNIIFKKMKAFAVRAIQGNTQ